MVAKDYQINTLPRSGGCLLDAGRGCASSINVVEDLADVAGVVVGDGAVGKVSATVTSKAGGSDIGNGSRKLDRCQRANEVLPSLCASYNLVAYTLCGAGSAAQYR